MDRAERRNKAKVEAKQRKKAKAAAWQTQIVLCYEEEPYVAFDATPEMLEWAVAVENPPMDDNDAAYAWVLASLTQLREDVALIRDHSEEVMLEAGRRESMTRKAILMAQYLLVRKQQNLANVGAVVLNLLACQSQAEINAPGFRVMALAEPLSVEDIRAMSTVQHMYSQEGDTIEKIPPPPSQQSKDRSKDRACVSIQAFWRNDQPDGIMLEIKVNVDQGQDSLDAEMEILDQVVMELAKTRPSADDCDEFLRYMAQQPKLQQPEEDRMASFQTIAAIAYAEEAGHLHSDEFNGMVYIYRVDENGFFIHRKDQPQTPA